MEGKIERGREGKSIGVRVREREGKREGRRDVKRE